MIKTIIFDIGGVLAGFDCALFMRGRASAGK